MLFFSSILTSTASLPLAATEIAADAVYEFVRLEALGDSPWVLPALGVGLVLLLVYVWVVYRREARTVTVAKATSLALLRTTALAGLVAFFLGLEKRSSTQVVEASRVVVLADTSLSMNLPNFEATASNTQSREQGLRDFVANSNLLQELSIDHDVEVVMMGETPRPMAYVPRQVPAGQTSQSDENRDSNNTEDDPKDTATAFDPSAIAAKLEPSGHETRLGDAIAATLDRYQGLPLAGMVLLTDGGQNRGLDLSTAAEAAAAANVRVHSIGFGPNEAPANLVLAELIAPERAYPGDTLTMQAVVRAQDMSGQQIELQTLRRIAPHGKDTNQPTAVDWELIDTQVLPIDSDDVLQTVRIETQPGEPGEYVYEVRALPTPRESQTDDNAQQAEVSVIDRETRVLLFAGGPARDYRFLRNQLQRDRSFTVDVLLESGTTGISQDANEILTEFPTTAEQLSKYDAIVAFDPNWSTLSTEQVRWLEQWVAQQAGGLVVVPGRINTPRWGADARMRTIRGLYPVRMSQQLLDLRSDGENREVSQPVTLTREGAEAEFLWLADSREDSDQSWEEFEGVFSAIEHNGPKPGATVYAQVSDDSTDNDGPAYLVGHYYGAGQVLMIGSGELWRLRKNDINHYERLWTSLLRHTSQGRLLQGSPRGKLLLAQDRFELGATVAVRAMMSDAQMEPLSADSVMLDLELPGGRTSQLALSADAARAGNFAGEFRVTLPGAYRLSLAVPDSTDELTRTIRVTTPQLEVGQTTRDAAALDKLATSTGAIYYQTPRLALEGDLKTPSLFAATPSQARSKRVVGSVDTDFAKQQSLWLLGLVAGALSLEWIVRRLSYLA